MESTDPVPPRKIIPASTGPCSTLTAQWTVGAIPLGQTRQPGPAVQGREGRPNSFGLADQRRAPIRCADLRAGGFTGRISWIASVSLSVSGGAIRRLRGNPGWSPADSHDKLTRTQRARSRKRVRLPGVRNRSGRHSSMTGELGFEEVLREIDRRMQPGWKIRRRRPAPPGSF
jgi:hypothetical protein